jgi:hypothetical protein
MGREKWLAVLLEVGLVSIEHAVEPWQKLLGAVVLSWVSTVFVFPIKERIMWILTV